MSFVIANRRQPCARMTTGSQLNKGTGKERQIGTLAPIGAPPLEKETLCSINKRLGLISGAAPICNNNAKSNTSPFNNNTGKFVVVVGSGIWYIKVGRHRTFDRH